MHSVVSPDGRKIQTHCVQEHDVKDTPFTQSIMHSATPLTTHLLFCYSDQTHVIPATRKGTNVQGKKGKIMITTG